jgi:hypothetical protein
VEDDDPFIERWCALMVHNFVSVMEEGVDIQFDLMLSAKHGDRDTAISLVLTYRSEEWLFIEGKRPLVLLIDGTRKEFSGEMNSSQRDVRGSTGVVERMLCEIQRETISALCTARLVRGALFGSKGQCEFTLTRENIERLISFAVKYNLI